jgi:hypothetical protein
MSITHFLKMPDVRAKLKPLRPGPLRKIAGALTVEPRSKRYMVVGTAFDYLLRFELQRRAPHAVARCWVAESAPDSIWKKSDKVAFFMPLSRDDKGVISLAARPHGDVHSIEERAQEKELAQELAGRARKVIEMAKLAHAAYLKNTSPTRLDQADLAGHAIRLAKLDDIPRAGRLDSTFEEAAAEDVEDLLALLAIVPFNALLNDKVVFLNPDFGQTSALVGGTDADLIVGDMLLDFKVTKSDKMAANYLDELLCFYLLARRHRQADPTFPVINRLALYFARHGHLWTWDATTWTEHPLFAETEEWFFGRANEVFKAKQPAPARTHETTITDLAALVALKKRLDMNPRVLRVNRSNPKGAEWTVNSTRMRSGPRLQLQVVLLDGSCGKPFVLVDAHHLLTRGMLRFEDDAGRWRLEF